GRRSWISMAKSFWMSCRRLRPRLEWLVSIKKGRDRVFPVLKRGDAVTAFLAFYQVFSATLVYLAEKRQFTAEKNT
ncbi:hypothetical protein ACI3PL_16540, partial [Lacticaseibacillus paracasei]